LGFSRWFGRVLGFRVAGQDESSDQLQFLFNTGDGPSGWSVTRRFIQALERSGIQSLKERPISIGEVGSIDAFVIG
jgi:hypothetical protein